jgi:hypothetical protein
VTFLADLIDDTAASTVSIAELLRRVRVLASRAKAPEVALWAKNEAEGYDDLDDLPLYRGPLPTQVFVNFTGPYGSYVPRVPIAVEHIPRDMREGAAKHFENYILQGVGEIEAQLTALTESDEKELAGPWNASYVALINHKISQGEIQWKPMHQVETIYRTVTPFALAGVLEAVRSRLLDFLLALEDAKPLVHGDQQAEVLPTPEKVQNIFHTVVMDRATASIGIAPTAINVVAASLPAKYAEAIEAAAQREPDDEQAGFLRRVGEWVGSAGRDIFVDVAAATLNRQIGGPS